MLQLTSQLSLKTINLQTEAMAECSRSKSFSDPVSFEALEKEGFPVTGTIKNIYVAPDCGFVVEVTTKATAEKLT